MSTSATLKFLKFYGLQEYWCFKAEEIEVFAKMKYG